MREKAILVRQFLDGNVQAFSSDAFDKDETNFAIKSDKDMK